MAKVVVSPGARVGECAAPVAFRAVGAAGGFILILFVHVFSMEPADIAELSSLLSQSTRPAVRALLAAALHQHAPVPAAPAAPVSGGGGGGGGGGAPVPAAGVERWATPRYSYEQSNEYVTLLIFDLPPMSPEVKAGATCVISASSVFLTIPHLGGPGGEAGFRLLVEPLEKEINVAESSFKFKKTQVEVKLRKKTQWEHWGSLVGKAGKAAAAAEKDPGAGLMDMMKDLYNDGTPEMKKTIAEAWQKSREKGGGGDGGGDF